MSSEKISGSFENVAPGVCVFSARAPMVVGSVPLTAVHKPAQSSVCNTSKHSTDEPTSFTAQPVHMYLSRYDLRPAVYPCMVVEQ